jgi:uncharacterized damage-inducible protein DinB
MTWTVPKIHRTPEASGDERMSLDSYLDHQRQTLLDKCAGLTAEQLVISPIGRSTLSLLGLIRHLAEVERVWFRTRFAGQDLGYLYFTEDFPERDFEDLDPARAEADFATYAEEVRLARDTVADRSLDDTFTRSTGEQANLRWVYLHLLVEYARHNGHADLIREQIDGRTGD